MEVFYCSDIRSKLLSDTNISPKNDDFSFEDELVYDAPYGFADIEIKCPTPFLLDRMTKVLKGAYITEEIERETSINFLAMR